MTKTGKIVLSTSLIVLIALAFGAYFMFKEVKSVAGQMSTKDFLHSEAPTEKDTLTAEEKMLAQLDSIAMKNARIKKNKVSGKRISVLITGVDSRIGYKGKRADANHLVNIYLDSAFIEIISIPRATKTTRRPYLANLRAIEGEKVYMEEVCKIAGVDKIDYHVEFGLSQAIGLLELLGYKKNAVQILRTLRSRKTYGAGDYQRSYNQGQFIRQMLLKIFPHLNEFNFEVVKRGGLMLVDTDIDISAVNDIVEKLTLKGFPKSDNDVIVTLKPETHHRLKVLNFRDKDSLDKEYRRIARLSRNPNIAEDTIKDSKTYSSAMVSRKVTRKLDFKIKKAKEFLPKNPRAAIKKLEVPVKQRSWIQIRNKKKRFQVRQSMCDLLIQALELKDRKKEADEIRRILESELEIERLLKEQEEAKAKADSLKKIKADSVMKAPVDSLKKNKSAHAK